MTFPTFKRFNFTLVASFYVKKTKEFRKTNLQEGARCLKSIRWVLLG